MKLFNKAKSFFAKEYYDFDRSDITLYNLHPQLRICLFVNGIFFNNRNSRVRLIWPLLYNLLTLVAIALEIMLTYRGLMLKDYAFASESLFYVMVVGIIPILSASVLSNKEVIFKLLEDMNEDFTCICKLGPRHRDHFLAGQLIIWKLFILWFSFCTFVCSLFIANTVVLTIYQCLFATQDEHMVRPLIFPMWLPKDDPYRTPNYEIFMLMEIVLIWIMFQNFCAYVYMQFHFLLHYYNLMDMIIMDLDVLFDGLDETVAWLPRHDQRRIAVQRALNSKMKRIVNWHCSVFKSMDTISSLYGPPLVYLVMFSSVAICIMAYQVVDQLEHGKVNYLFAILCFGTVMQLWIPCYLGTLIGDKAFSIADACWDSGWQNTPLGRMVRMDIIIMMLRAQQPLYIQFTGLPSLTLEAFSSMMSTSYSYFNMLRQFTKD